MTNDFNGIKKILILLNSLIDAYFNTKDFKNLICLSEHLKDTIRFIYTLMILETENLDINKKDIISISDVLDEFDFDLINVNLNIILNQNIDLNLILNKIRLYNINIKI